MSENTSQQETKKNNKFSILKLIKKTGPVSQAHIARELDLRASTVSNLSRELREDGFVEIVGKGSSGKNGGKRSNLLSISPDFACFSALYIHQDTIVSHLVDYLGRIHRTETRRFAPESPERVIELVSSEINGHRKNCETYRGAGIAVSSVVNSRGDVSTSPDFPWQMPNFTGAVLSRTDGSFPVIVENDANCAALFQYHAFKEAYPNLLLFLYSEGHESLGGGIILDGQLYKGSRSDAGEIIHQEKEDLVDSFAGYIARIGSFLAPDIIVLASDGPAILTDGPAILTDGPASRTERAHKGSGNSGALAPEGEIEGIAALEKIYRTLGQEPVAAQLYLSTERGLPVLGAADIISRAVTRTLI